MLLHLHLVQIVSTADMEVVEVEGEVKLMDCEKQSHITYNP